MLAVMVVGVRGGWHPTKMGIVPSTGDLGCWESNGSEGGSACHCIWQDPSLPLLSLHYKEENTYDQSHPCSH